MWSFSQAWLASGTITHCSFGATPFERQIPFLVSFVWPKSGNISKSLYEVIVFGHICSNCESVHSKFFVLNSWKHCGHLRRLSDSNAVSSCEHEGGIGRTTRLYVLDQDLFLLFTGAAYLHSSVSGGELFCQFHGCAFLFAASYSSLLLFNIENGVAFHFCHAKWSFFASKPIPGIERLQKVIKGNKKTRGGQVWYRASARLCFFFLYVVFSQNESWLMSAILAEVNGKQKSKHVTCTSLLS